MLDQLRLLDGAAGSAAGPLRILIVSDAWEPQVNGVVRTMRTVVNELLAWAMVWT